MQVHKNVVKTCSKVNSVAHFPFEINDLRQHRLKRNSVIVLCLYTIIMHFLCMFFMLACKCHACQNRSFIYHIIYVINVIIKTLKESMTYRRESSVAPITLLSY